MERPTTTDDRMGLRYLFSKMVKGDIQCSTRISAIYHERRPNMPARVDLKKISRQDITRVADWLLDTEISSLWFGSYSYENPAHLGYDPDKMINASEDEWNATFNEKQSGSYREVFSIYETETGEHIGEAQLAIEAGIGDGQISVLIGRKDKWHKGHGTAATLALLDHAFQHLNLHRIWADIPEYNKGAVGMFERIGFQHEGALRKKREQGGANVGLIVMGILLDEFTRRYPEGVQSHVIDWKQL